MGTTIPIAYLLKCSSKSDICDLIWGWYPLLTICSAADGRHTRNIAWKWFTSKHKNCTPHTHTCKHMHVCKVRTNVAETCLCMSMHVYLNIYIYIQYGGRDRERNIPNGCRYGSISVSTAGPIPRCNSSKRRPSHSSSQHLRSFPESVTRMWGGRKTQNLYTLPV